jgi:bifunctional UDP-N-acetylglucosamine pyrophosphorylase/glucosamine-1-phosphate N-acetyltransferase
MIDVVILAAGPGKRLWPVTNEIPKCMARILQKPLLEWMAEGVFPYARKIIVIVGSHKEKVIAHFEKTPLARKMVFVEQAEQKGTSHALLCAEKHVEGNFLVLNGDNFFDPSFYERVEGEMPKGFFLVGKSVSEKSAFGEIVEEKGFLKEIREKTGLQGEGIINTNAFYGPKEFFDFLRNVALSSRGELELIDAVNDFAKKEKVRVVEQAGYWNDIGFYWNLLETSEFALRNLMKNEILGVVEQGVHVEGSLHLGKGSVIKAPSRVEGPVWVGENTVVGPNAFLRAGACVEDNCHIGSSEIKNSIVMSKSNAPHFNYVGDSIICEDVNLGAGAIIANLRFDNKTIYSEIQGKNVSSGRRKLGCVIGAGTKIGINASFTCGKLVGSNCKVYPRVFIKNNIPDSSVIME